jgi:hypothetical protein
MAENRNTAGKAVPASLIAQVAAGIRYTFTGKAPDWFGPLSAPPPQAPEDVAGRRFDYPTGYNINSTPRQDEAISFGQMRAFADGYDLLRLVIETRKDQLAKLEWTIAKRGKAKEQDERCQALIDFFAAPDRLHTWDEWLRMMLEDMLVIDAPTLYARRTKGGDLYAFEPMDGGTIKLLLDPAGRSPLPPDPAYSQQLKGVAAVQYTRDELVYKPRNPRTHKVYGYSPVEQIIMTVNIALRRQCAMLDYYTEGSVPDALAGVPAEWSTKQISEFQDYWDALFEGDRAKKRKLRFVPGEIAKNFHETKQSPLKDEFDEWLARVICYAFSVEVTPFIAQVNRATAQTNREQTLTEGLAPIQKWVKGLMDTLIQSPAFFGYADLEFDWIEEEAISSVEQAQINAIYLNAKVLHPDEVRADIGRPPLTAEQKADMTPVDPLAINGGDGEEKPNGKGKPPADGEDDEQDDDVKKAERPIHVTVNVPEVRPPDVYVEGVTVHAHVGGETETVLVPRESS